MKIRDEQLHKLRHHRQAGPHGGARKPDLPEAWDIDDQRRGMEEEAAQARDEVVLIPCARCGHVYTDHAIDLWSRRCEVDFDEGYCRCHGFKFPEEEDDDVH